MRAKLPTKLPKKHRNESGFQTTKPKTTEGTPTAICIYMGKKKLNGWATVAQVVERLVKPKG